MSRASSFAVVNSGGRPIGHPYSTRANAVGFAKKHSMAFPTHLFTVRSPDGTIAARLLNGMRMPTD